MPRRVKAVPDQNTMARQRTNKSHFAMTPKPSQGTVLPIQYLRGIAAMMVVFHHIKAQIPDF